MKARHIWVGAAAALLALGCGGGGDDKADTAPTVSTEETAYRAALKKVDPAVAEKRSAYDNGRNICLDIQQGKTTAEVAKNAAARFDVDAATGAKIVAATKASLCKSAG